MTLVDHHLDVTEATDSTTADVVEAVTAVAMVAEMIVTVAIEVTVATIAVIAMTDILHATSTVMLEAVMTDTDLETTDVVVATEATATNAVIAMVDDHPVMLLQPALMAIQLLVSQESHMEVENMVERHVVTKC